MQSALLPARLPVGVLLLAGLFGFGLVMRPEFLYAHVGLALVATAALIFLTISPAETDLNNRDSGWFWPQSPSSQSLRCAPTA